MPPARSVSEPVVLERLAQEVLVQVPMIGHVIWLEGGSMCGNSEPFPSVVRQFCADLPGIQSLALCITDGPNDAEEVVLH